MQCSVHLSGWSVSKHASHTSEICTANGRSALILKRQAGKMAQKWVTRKGR